MKLFLENFYEKRILITVIKESYYRSNTYFITVVDEADRDRKALRTEHREKNIFMDDPFDTRLLAVFIYYSFAFDSLSAS